MLGYRYSMLAKNETIIYDCMLLPHVFRVPENKQHMVLPEIEEEVEDETQRHSKLSLTSLLLGESDKSELST